MVFYVHFPAHVGDLNEGKPRACAHRLDRANVHGRVHDDYGYGYGRGYALPDFQVGRGQNKMYRTTYNLQHLTQVQRRPGLQHGGDVILVLHPPQIQIRALEFDIYTSHNWVGEFHQPAR